MQIFIYQNILFTKPVSLFWFLSIYCRRGWEKSGHFMWWDRSRGIFFLVEKWALGLKIGTEEIINVDSKLYVDNNYLNLQIRTVRENVCSSHSLLTAIWIPDYGAVWPFTCSLPLLLHLPYKLKRSRTIFLLSGSALDLVVATSKTNMNKYI